MPSAVPVGVGHGPAASSRWRPTPNTTSRSARVGRPQALVVTRGSDRPHFQRLVRAAVRAAAVLLRLRRAGPEGRQETAGARPGTGFGRHPADRRSAPEIPAATGGAADAATLAAVVAAR